MKYKAKIIVSGNPTSIMRAFAAEIKAGMWERSKYKIKKHKDHVEFIVNAHDAVALRATLDGIAKLLTVYEKVNKK